MSDKENKTTDTTAADQPSNDSPEQEVSTEQGPGFVMVGESTSESAMDEEAVKAADKAKSSERHTTSESAKDAKAKSAPVDGTASDTAKPASAEKTTASKKPEISSAKPRAEAGTSDKKGSVIALSALIIALGAAGLAGYTFWQQQEKTAQALTQLSERNNQLEAQLQRQVQSLNSLQPLPVTTQQLEAQSRSLQEKQKQQQQHLQELAGAFASSQGPKPSDWLQAEAEYLLRLANHRLQLEGDLTGAKTLLASADERLAKADNPALFAVRQAIANELAALNSIYTLDQSGLYFKLSALETQIQQLPLPMDPESRSAFHQTQLEENQEQNIWQALWNEAKTLIVVRHRDEKITPLLPPEESLYLRHNLRLTLQQAQIALLKEEQALFSALIKQAIDWVSTHFDQSATQTQSVLSTLKAFSEQSIRQQRPDISASLNLLRDLQKQRFSSSVPDTAPENKAPEVNGAVKNSTTEAPSS
ncbi:uroporphyrinogen-III C-methyltransferase [Oceanospirillum linum]|uniref:Heme biosynthesis operon protein HemX n=1 Tax=Oceanospirillum linum TaxID=966 RepID=A0A1T1HC28_OCELI|nr:uroporphyrinogen-III C-methyltransferase [Oceanospirillum linum]OOV87287.1 hypothetical protein BTA35_0209945 [Oceanospirillum linum]SEF80178.1 uroporphyrin-3 C-methyltransferase [Oleiphilus messinensis]SMP18746.1 uroporphyrin-3 C-methyltransferase [Oceanospirillum linum]